MELRKYLTKENINNLTIILALVTFVSALLGYLSNGLGLSQSIYSVYGFFGGEGDSEDIANSLLLSIAAITAPLSVTTLILLIFYRKISACFFLSFMAKGHIVIAGLGNMGSTLARDILADKKIDYSKLVILESDESNPAIEEMVLQGAIVIEDRGNTQKALKRASAHKAKKVFAFMGNDIRNIELALELNELVKLETQNSALTCYLHIQNRENNELLRDEAFKNLNIKHFDIYDGAAQTLFMKHPLGCNVDTIESDAKVKLAIVGFDKVGESILFRALNLGYFYNQQAIEIVVFDKDIESKKREFLKQHPIELTMQGYWDVAFRDIYDFYDDGSLPFTQIVFCGVDTQESFADAMRLMKSNSAAIIQRDIHAYLFSDTNESVAKLIDNDNERVFKNLHTFGEFNTLCSYDVIVNERLDMMAIRSNERYNELHGYSYPWESLDTFTKDSNRFQVEHLSVKLKVVNHFLAKKEKQGDYETQKQESLKRWFVYGGNMIWDKMEKTKELAEYLPLDVLDRLAYIEHTRWNAFHILHGWKGIAIEEVEKKYKNLSKDDLLQMKQEVEKSPKKMTDEEIVKKIKSNNFRKFKNSKEHACLVDWNDLGSVSQFFEHDYKSDDIETVMRVYDMVKGIDNDKCFMSKLVAKLYENLDNLNAHKQNQ